MSIRRGLLVPMVCGFVTTFLFAFVLIEYIDVVHLRVYNAFWSIGIREPSIISLITYIEFVALAVICALISRRLTDANWFLAFAAFAFGYLTGDIAYYFLFGLGPVDMVHLHVLHTLPYMLPALVTAAGAFWLLHRGRAASVA